MWSILGAVDEMDLSGFMARIGLTVRGARRMSLGWWWRYFCTRTRGNPVLEGDRAGVP